MGVVGFPDSLLLSVGLCMSSRCGSSEVDGSSTTTAEPTPVMCSPAKVVSDFSDVEIADCVVVIVITSEDPLCLSSTTGSDTDTGEVKWSTTLETCTPSTRVALMSICGDEYGFSTVVGLPVVVVVVVEVVFSVVVVGFSVVLSGGEDGTVNFSVTSSTGSCRSGVATTEWDGANKSYSCCGLVVWWYAGRLDDDEYVDG